ncbi:RICIN domain-containing protein [Streptomyces sp. V4-01]|uniref:RICIN domain-containing protein n=1 Tax=Actinacidiphila polyblastidii TaxID=3110430 RepID=A0ABU7PIQ6_9ACTN|nr:RICIN domain-containing protein [Streptomyces sp. V4-01]
MIGRRTFLTAATATGIAVVGATAAPGFARTAGGTAQAAPDAATLGTSNANAAFTALNNAFLVSNGNQRYYKTSLNNTEKDYFWRQALDIQAVEDVYTSNPTTDTRNLVGALLDTFLQQNQGGGGLYDWNWNDYNDDLLWAGLAFARGYRITGNQTYLNQAKYAFDRVYNRGWDSALGGGVWWSVDKNEKSALSNSPAVILGCLIYESNGGSAYLTKARAIYDWTWNTLLDRSTGAVHEKIQANGNLDSGETVYSAGAFVSAAQAIYRNQGGGSLFDDAKRTVDWVIRDRTTNGIMTNGQREGTWQSEFARGMGEFVSQNNQWGPYYDFMKRNADAAWNARRTDLNLTWNRWDAQTPRDDTRAVESIGAVIMQAVTPAAPPSSSGSSIVSGATYQLICARSGEALDNGSANADGAPAMQWTGGGGTQQRWTVTSVGGGYYKLVSRFSGKALDNGNTTTDGAAVIQWTDNGGPQQQWAITSVGSGAYKLTCRQGGKALDNGNTTDVGAAVVQWTDNGGSPQQWKFVQV